jgi:hypothetical protein
MMSFKEFLEQQENRGGTKMRIPDGRATSISSGRAGQSQATPEKPQTTPVHLTVPPSTINPGSLSPKSRIPAGPFGGSGMGRGDWPKKPSAFGGPMTPPNFTPTPSQFANTGKFRLPTNLK